MKNLMRCKDCGFIIEAHKLGSFCPACGIYAKRFEPYNDKVSPGRRKILDLYLHPITIHFPQTFSVLISFLYVLTYFLPAAARTQAIISAGVLSLFLPPAVLGGFITGLIDGKMRFKKFSPSHLKRKVIVGLVFLAIAPVPAFTAFCVNDEGKIIVYGIISGLACVVCSVILGKTGERLMYALLPGTVKVFGRRM
jgi:rubredoxin